MNILCFTTGIAFGAALVYILHKAYQEGGVETLARCAIGALVGLLIGSIIGSAIFVIYV